MVLLQEGLAPPGTQELAPLIEAVNATLPPAQFTTSGPASTLNLHGGGGGGLVAPQQPKALNPANSNNVQPEEPLP